MGVVLVDGHVKLAVLAELGHAAAGYSVLVHVSRCKLFLTELALGLLVELLLVLFLTVNVIHFTTGGALLDIPAAVSEVRGDLGLRELLQAVITPLHWLRHHLVFF